MPLVQPPRPPHRDPGPPARVEGEGGGADRPRLQRRVHHVGQHAGVGEQLAGARGLGLAGGERSASHQPVNRLASFHVDWPWRSSTRVSDMADERTLRAFVAPKRFRRGARGRVPRSSCVRRRRRWRRRRRRAPAPSCPVARRDAVAEDARASPSRSASGGHAGDGAPYVVAADPPRTPRTEPGPASAAASSSTSATLADGDFAAALADRGAPGRARPSRSATARSTAPTAGWVGTVGRGGAGRRGRRGEPRDRRRARPAPRRRGRPRSGAAPRRRGPVVTTVTETPMDAPVRPGGLTPPQAHRRGRVAAARWR